MKQIDLSFMKNMRDLGGLKTIDGRIVKMGRLYRSGHLNRLSKKDIDILNSLHITKIIDFRNSIEFINKADYMLDGVKYFNFSALEEDKRLKERYKNADSNLLILLDKEHGGFKHMIKTYKSLATSKVSIDAYIAFFKELQEKDQVVLWHCSQGKDRAGVAAYLLERALGVSEKDAMDDYLFTNLAMELKIKQLTPYALKVTNNDYSYLPILKEVFDARSEYLNAFLEEVNKNYGNLDVFLKDILKVDVDLLKDLYLE